jgi:hypothetical protein
MPIYMNLDKMINFSFNLGNRNVQILVPGQRTVHPDRTSANRHREELRP